MSLLENWVQTPGAAALGWTLVHSLWEGAVIALALAVALYFLQSSRARYAAGCLAMLGLIAMAVLTFTRLMLQERMLHIPLTKMGGVPPVPLLLDTQSIGAKPRLPLRADDYLSWLAPLWIAGVLIFHLRGMMSWMAARRLRRTGVCCAPNLWQDQLDRLSAQLRLSKPIALLESCLAETPVVIGYIRPVILMPIGLLAGLPASQIEAILLHELAHIRRYDYVVNLLQIFVEDLLFYHPAVWWVSGVIRAERENCCDDLVVAVTGGAYAYATALAALEQNRTAPREALAVTGGSLAKRIRRLLHQPEPHPAALTPVFSAAILTIMLVTAMVAWQSKPADLSRPPAPTPAPVLAAPAATRPSAALLAQVKPTPTPQREEKPAKELEGPFKAWVNEDVAYIIKDDEKLAWKRLATNEERERFIEQFWLRRDPTPGTPENEFKEEHYRRIAYANQRFGAAKKSGWKTDRGRIYITYGPPDEIEDHRSGGTYERPPQEGGGTISTHPFQQWRYHHIEGVGNGVIMEFVDALGSGEFRMTMDPSEKENKDKSDGYVLNALPDADHATSRTGATVMVGNNTVLISVPLNTHSDHPVDVYGRIFTKEGRLTNAFKQTVKGPVPVYSRFIPVRVGSYQLKLLVLDGATGELAADTLEFEVK